MDRTGKVLGDIEFVLSRPDVYLGTIKNQKQTMYVWVDNKPVLKEVKIHNGIYMIIREIISNVIDHVWRSEEKGIPVTKIVITVNTTTGEISVLNDGLSIPIVLTDYEYTDPRNEKKIVVQKYPAEVFFGDMRAGTNYDDENARKTSGKNGIGATVCNILSSKFKVECTDPENHKKFVQEYSNNARERTKPKVTKFSGTTAATKITFIPDYAFFKQKGMTSDLESVLAFYAREIAAITGVPVKYNNTLIKIPSFDKFAKMVVPKGKMEYLKAPNGDECIVIESINEDADSIIADDLSHYSYVNGIRTTKGGIHIKAWRDLIVPPYVRAFNARKGTKANPMNKTSAKNVYPHLYLFVRVNVDRPDFGSGNVKDELVQIYSGTNEKKKINYTFGESDAFDAKVKQIIDKMLKWPMTKKIEDIMSGLNDAKLDRASAAKKKIAKTGKNYSDAEDAGSKKTKEGTILNLCEGLSASTLIVTGVSKLPEHQRRKYGYLALRGKVINASKCTRSKLLENAEVKLLIDLLGLDISKKMSSSELRYAMIRVLTDADDDGIHIKGLIYNLLRTIAPQLLIENGFIQCHETPVVQLTLKGKGSPKINFFTNEEYAQWIAKPENKATVRGEPRYIKGLGAIDDSEAGAYFKEPTLINYTYNPETDDDAMALAFDNIKKDANGNNPRYEWICNAVGKDINMSFEPVQTLTQFVNEKMVVFDRMTLRRALPCIWDSFKEGPRKVFYAMRKKRYTNHVKLEQITGAINEVAAYHHGSASLAGTLAGMGFFFVGSNNIRLIDTFGGVGSRLEGGKDHASGRYLQAKYNPICDLIFPKELDDILPDSDDPETNPEKKHYVPIIPLVLCNGSAGIATGASCDIPACNPDTLIEYVENWLDGGILPTITPWYHGYKGEISVSEDGKRWYSKGILEKCTDKKHKNWWQISELPIGEWTLPFIEKKIEPMVNPKSGSPAITDYNTYGGTKDEPLIRIKPANDFIPSMDHKNNFDCLIKSHPLTNMTMVDENDRPIRVDSLNEIAQLYCEHTLPFYVALRKHLMKSIKNDIDQLKNKLKFVKSVVIDKSLDLYKPNDVIYSKMDSLGIDRGEDGTAKKLLDMPARSLTKEKIEALSKEIASAKVKFSEIKKSEPKDLWKAHLQPLKKAWKAEVDRYWKVAREGSK